MVTLEQVIDALECEVFLRDVAIDKAHDTVRTMGEKGAKENPDHFAKVSYYMHEKRMLNKAIELLKGK